MTNAPSGAGDRFAVYRTMLDLIGKSEGTDKGRGYNETLGYGMMLDGKVTKGKGPTVILSLMTLDQVEALQTRMLKDPDNNRLNSSAIRRYQIIRTTLRAIRKQFPATYPGSRLFDADCQDEMACYLLGQRGIDKWLSGRLSTDTLIRNLAQEWASIPKPDGKGHYAGQSAGVTVDQVKAALAEVERRHKEGQPPVIIEKPVPVPVETPVVPERIDQKVKEKPRRWAWLTGLFGGGGIGIGGLFGMDWQAIAALGTLILIFVLVLVFLGERLAKSVEVIRGEVEG